MASPGMTTIDTIIERVVLLVETYIDAEVDLIDTRNNTVSGAASSGSFTTPSIPALAVQAYIDQFPGQEIRIIITDEGEQRSGEAQYYAQGFGSNPPSAHPTMDRTHRVGVTVLAANTGGAQTTSGATDTFHARKVCNRVADAVRVIMARFPQLDVPSASKGVLVCSTALSADGRAQQVSEDDHQLYARELVYDVRTIEDRST